ncbi:MAG: radical SAM family heme chaperone HemW [Myxococcales bacterium]|nr:radical SAM family heme chaperone HemW [Myxococcales bacterium]
MRAVYVHFPWCVQRCPYCDFATVAELPQKIPHARYSDAVVAEWALRRRADLPRPETLFFGGGTPSLWSLDALGRVVAAVGATGEVTVECNPTSLDEAHARALSAAGVNRLSIGVQSLRDHHLRYLGRVHDADEALGAVRAAVRSGLRVSADLMFGLDQQTLDALVGDAQQLIDAGVEHLSCYALTIEPATRFGELARKGRLPRMHDDAVAELYLGLESYLHDQGFEHYEVSNYARPGCESVHNRAYWRGEDYVGLGAGAVGAVTRPGEPDADRWRNDADVAAYLSAIETGRLPPAECERLDAETRVREALLLGMRTREGTALSTVEARTGLDPRVGREAVLARERARGNVRDDDGRWRIPSSRWLHADDIIARLF